MVDKGMTHVPAGAEQDGGRFHPVTQNSREFKAYVISGILHLVFLDHNWPQVTEILENETTNKGRPL